MSTALQYGCEDEIAFVAVPEGPEGVGHTRGGYIDGVVDNEGCLLLLDGGDVRIGNAELLLDTEEIAAANMGI